MSNKNSSESEIFNEGIGAAVKALITEKCDITPQNLIDTLFEMKGRRGMDDTEYREWTINAVQCFMKKTLCPPDPLLEKTTSRLRH